MRLITTNEQLLALLPNIMTVVKGEHCLLIPTFKIEVQYFV